MTSIWGKLEKPTPIKLHNIVPDKSLTKPEIRQQVWDFLEKHDLVNFPRPVYNRIPNFKGAATAGQKVSSLPEFKNAHVIKVNPDKPQEEVRYQTLDHRKTLLVPTPRLARGLFNQLDNPAGSDKELIRKLASRQGIDHHSKPLPMTSNIKIDLIVLGCVAVDKKGYRIGKGEGFADLEYAMAASLGAVNADTIVIATIHDCQLFDSLPEELFGDHDVPVDIIVTPTLIHRVEQRLPKPKEIIWKILSLQKLKKIPVLKQMRIKDRKAGKDVQLKDEIDTDENVIVKKSNPKQKEIVNQNIEKSTIKQNNSSKEINMEKEDLSKNIKFDNRQMLYVGKISRDTRVREFKNALLERGIRPKELIWKGFKGFAFMYFDASQNIDDLLETLKDLKIGDSVLDIQKEKIKD